MSNLKEQKDTGTTVKDRPTVKRPSMFKVVLINDDYTAMEYVVDILQRFFHKGKSEATKIMKDVHKKGSGIAGIYTYEIAETKAVQVMDDARKNEFPLQLTLEEE